MTGTDLCEICVQLRHHVQRRPKPKPATHHGTDASGREWRACWPHHEVLSAWLWVSLKKELDL